MGDPKTFDVILLTHIMDLHMSSRGTLEPEERCCMFYAKSLLRSDMWFFASTLF